MGWPHATLTVSPSDSSYGSQAGPVTCTTSQNSLTRLGLRSDLLVPCPSAPQIPLAGVTVKILPCTNWPNRDHFGAADAA